MAGILRLVNDGGGSQTQLTASGSTDRNIALPDADGVLVVEPTASGGGTGAYLARNADATAAERTASGEIYFQDNVGIGLNNPVSPLHVKSTDTSGGTIATFDDSGSGNTGRLLILTTGGQPNDRIRVASTNRSLTLGSAATDHLYIAGSNGNVGINTILPNAKLCVSGTTAITGPVAFGRDTADNRVKLLVSESSLIRGGGGTSANGGYGILCSPNFDTISNIGTGGTNLSVFGAAPQITISGTVDTLKHFTFNAGTYTNRATNEYGYFSSLNGDNNYGFYGEGTSPNYFSGPTYFRLNNPQFWINQTLTNNAAIRLVAHNNSAGNQIEAPIIIAGGSVPAKALISYTSNDSSSSTSIKSALVTDSAGHMSFDNTSDYRIKENIVTLPSAVNIIKNLNPVTFNFTYAPDFTTIGFIAHEMQEAGFTFGIKGSKDETQTIGTINNEDGSIYATDVPEPLELEYTEETTDNEGVTTQTVRTRTWTATGARPKYQTVDETKLIPLLTKALQEALERIEALENANHN